MEYLGNGLGEENEQGAGERLPDQAGVPAQAEQVEVPAE